MNTFSSNMHTAHTKAHIYVSGPLTGVSEKWVSESGGGKKCALDE